MRLLVLLRGRSPEDQICFHDAFLQLVEDGILSYYDVIPSFSFSEQHGMETFYDEIIDRVVRDEIDIVFFQHFDSSKMTSSSRCMKRLRELKSSPLVLISSGDAFSPAWLARKDFPSCFKEVASQADLVFLTTMGDVAQHVELWGTKNIVLLPHGVCQVRCKPPNSIDAITQSPEYDVSFVGGNVNCRNPLSLYYKYSKMRQQLIKKLCKRYGSKFAVFGPGWKRCPCSKGQLEFDRQSRIGEQTRVIFGGFPGSLQRYYASDRPFFQGVSLAGFVDWYVPGINKILRDGDHIHLCKNPSEMFDKIDMLLAMDREKLVEITLRRSNYLFEKHTVYHRMKFAMSLAVDMVVARREGRKAAFPKIDFFLPEVDVEEESKHAVINWQG